MALITFRNKCFRYYPGIFCTWFLDHIGVGRDGILYMRLFSSHEHFLPWSEINKVVLLKHRVSMMYGATYFAKRLAFYNNSGRVLSINITTRYCGLDDPAGLVAAVGSHVKIEHQDVTSLHSKASWFIFGLTIMLVAVL